MKIQIELELADVSSLLTWRVHDKQTFTSMGMEASKKADKVIDKIVEQVEFIVGKIERDNERGTYWNG